MAANRKRARKAGRIFIAPSGSIILVLASRYMASYDVPYIYKLGTNNVKFSDKYYPDATLLIPAAYSNPDRTVQGEYRIAGKIYGEPNRLNGSRSIPPKGWPYRGDGSPITASCRPC